LYQTLKYKTTDKFNFEYQKAFNKENFLNKKLGSYIEGDGHIYVPLEHIKARPYISIAFVAKDLPLARKLQNIFSGTLTDYNTYVVINFYKIESVIFLACLLNGHMRTPKNRSFT